MKKIFLILALSFCYFFNVAAQKDKIEQIFDQYQDTEGVTSIKIAKPMFGMLSKLNIQDSELNQIKPLLNKIQGLKILIIENEGGTRKNLTSVASNIMSSINKLNYQELMTVNNKDAKIKFLSGEAKDGFLDNLLLNINSEGNNVLMMLDGKISMDDVNNLINETQDVINAKPSKSSSTTRSSEERKVSNYNGIRISNGIKVNFTQGSNPKVVVTTDSDKQQYIKTIVENNILKIYVENKGKNNLNFNSIIVDIENKNLQQIEANSGANFLTNNTISSNNLKIDFSSGSNIAGDFDIKNDISIEVSSGASGKINIISPKLYFAGSSGSTITLNGLVTEATFDVSSAATVNAKDLKTEKTTIAASSASNARVNASKFIDSKTSSGASVRYDGNPKSVSVKNTSGGSTKPIN